MGFGVRTVVGCECGLTPEDVMLSDTSQHQMLRLCLLVPLLALLPCTEG